MWCSTSANSSLRRAAQIAKLGTGFSAFWMGGAALGWAWLAWAKRTARDEEDLRARAEARIRDSFRRYLRAVRRAGLVDFDLDANAPDRARLPDGPFVLLASHPTLIDVIAVLATWERTCVVAGGQWWGRSGIGRLLEAAGHIDGGDGGHEATERIFAEAQARLRRGLSVLIFPEGTRSPPHGLHPFKRGAFEIAARAGVPVVPLVIFCDPPALKKGVPWYEFPENGVRLWMKQLDAVHVPRGRSRTRQAAEDLRHRMETSSHE